MNATLQVSQQGVYGPWESGQTMDTALIIVSATSECQTTAEAVITSYVPSIPYDERVFNRLQALPDKTPNISYDEDDDL